MADGYWSRQQQVHPSGGMLKRPRSEYDISPAGLPPAHDMRNYVSRDEDRHGPQVVKEAKSIASEYDRYLKNSYSAFPGGGGMYGEAALGRDGGRMPASGGRPTYSLADPSIARSGDVRRELGSDAKNPIDAMARPGSETVPLPRDASNTLYIEGLPPNSTRREVAHIFRPFVGYKEVRLVTKDSKHRGGDPLILCFVDFASPACAATAMSAIQGYKMDEHDRDSAYLRLQFSKHPGPRSGSGHRGRR